MIGRVIMSILFLIVATLLQSILAQQEPKISYITPEKIKNVGETAEFQCSVQNGQDYPVLWVKTDKGSNDQLPLSMKTALIIKDSRLTLRHDTNTSTYTLQIRDIQESDAGTYECQILISLNDRMRAEVELQVRRAPFINDNTTRTVVANEGDSVVLECYAGGFPVPKISWRREDIAILPIGGSIYRGNILKISSIRKEDRGTYYCIAENGVGQGARRDAQVEVKFAPIVWTPRPRVGQALQYDAELVCHVEAYPSPIITWFKNDVELLNNQHHRISHSATSYQTVDSTLHIITIEKEQYGRYVCKASNKFGNISTALELFESVIPVCPPACE